MIYYCIRKAAAARHESRMICDNYVGGKMPRYRTKAEAVAELKRIGGEALGEGYAVESLREHRPGQSYNLCGLRFSDAVARYFVDLLRVNSADFKRLEGIAPEDMNVRPMAGDWVNEKFS